MIAGALGIGTEFLAPLDPPSVMHYSGHRIGYRFPEMEEARARGEIAERLRKREVGFGYGSLAAGADILFAEELLHSGAELNVTLPFDLEEFRQISVAPAGGQISCSATRGATDCTE
jgi:hypothetical protein